MTTSKTSCRNLSVVMVLDSLDHTLAQALSCFASQSLEHQDFEILLIGDASFREEVASLIERYSSLSIRFLTCPYETQIGRALNLGAQNARGDIVLIHDSKLFADTDLLRAHLEAHQMPSNQDIAILSSVESLALLSQTQHYHPISLPKAYAERISYRRNLVQNLKRHVHRSTVFRSH